jgi:DNA polymerase sigma
MPDHVGSTQATSPDQRVRERRQRTIAKVERSIQTHFGQEFRIGAFGSTQYGVDGLNSDLDLVVIVGFFLMFHL